MTINHKSLRNILFIVTIFISQSIMASRGAFQSEELQEGVEGAYLCYQPLDSQELMDLWKSFARTCKGDIKNTDRVQGNLRLQWELEGVFDTFVGTLRSAVPDSVDDRNQEAAVVYLSSSPAPLETVEEMTGSVEMFMSSHASQNVSFFTHIGITRSPFFAKENQHRRVSMYLHSFGARVVREAYNGEKIAMVTTPLPAMSRIFEESLGLQSVYTRCLKRKTRQDLPYIYKHRRERKIVSDSIQMGRSTIHTFEEYIRGQTPREWYLSNRTFSANLNMYVGIFIDDLAAWAGAHPYIEKKEEVPAIVDGTQGLEDAATPE